jgi:primary-amine oxidase
MLSFLMTSERKEILTRNIKTKLDHDDQLYPAGKHVPQSSGDGSKPLGLAAWAGPGHERDSIDNTDIVLWHTFGVTHFPSPEDFPIMPAEPMTLLLRPRNFFAGNPVMDVPPSFVSLPSQVKNKNTNNANEWRGLVDETSKLAFGDGNGDVCCKN